MAIVCRSCNTRHASMDGDSYRDMPKDHKQCPACKKIKPATSFFLDNNRGGVLRRTSYCKPCSQERTRLTRRKIAERKRREAPAGAIQCAESLARFAHLDLTTPQRYSVDRKR